jgi:hypothetical protein
MRKKRRYGMWLPWVLTFAGTAPNPLRGGFPPANCFKSRILVESLTQLVRASRDG